MSYAAFWILLTDILWTLACIGGLYYGIGLVRHARAAYRYSAGTFPRRRTREQFRLTKVAGSLLVAAVGLGCVLGLIVIVQDLVVWSSPVGLAIEAVRVVYRFILVGVMVLQALALRKLWQVYEMWGEE